MVAARESLASYICLVYVEVLNIAFIFQTMRNNKRLYDLLLCSDIKNRFIFEINIVFSSAFLYDLNKIEIIELLYLMNDFARK